MMTNNFPCVIYSYGNTKLTREEKRKRTGFIATGEFEYPAEYQLTKIKVRSIFA